MDISGENDEQSKEKLMKAEALKEKLCAQYPDLEIEYILDTLLVGRNNIKFFGLTFLDDGSVSFQVRIKGEFEPIERMIFLLLQFKPEDSAK